MKKYLIFSIFFACIALKAHAAEDVRTKFTTTFDAQYKSEKCPSGVNIPLVIKHYKESPEKVGVAIPYILVKYLKSIYRLRDDKAKANEEKNPLVAKSALTAKNTLVDVILPQLEKEITERLGITLEQLSKIADMEDVKMEILLPSIPECLDKSKPWGFDLDRIRQRELILRLKFGHNGVDDVAADICLIRRLKTLIHDNKKSNLEIVTQAVVTAFQNNIVVGSSDQFLRKQSLAAALAKTSQRLKDMGIYISENELNTLPMWIDNP